MLIMVDGIDGSGKSSVLAAWKKYLLDAGNTIFDIVEYWKQNAGRYPEYSEIKSYDFIFSCEPTYSAMGKIIREELIKNTNHYPARAISEAYSLDRLILYSKIIIPALKDNKIIIQDRGVSTSLCYQPLTDPNLNFIVLSALPGNNLALEYRPDHLVLLDIKPKEALARLLGRANKNDKAIFEKLDFQTKAAALFASPEFSKMFTALGTKVHHLPASQKVDIMHKESLNLLHQLLNS